jgi:CDP-diacylglycerol pyrophosphatase
LHGSPIGISAAALIVIVALASVFAGPLRAQTPQALAPSAPSDRVAAACVVAPRPNSLWSLAQCCARDLRSNPDCRYYSKSDKFIILKDNNPKKTAAYLIIPSIKVTGIEDRQIFSPPVVDFWEYGWQQAQRFVEQPLADVALAINSVHGRTQNQLHIHIACVLPAVARTLANHSEKIGPDPIKALRLDLGPDNHTYRVLKVSNLAAADSPFNLVAAMPGARADMGDQGIAVVGSTTPGVYYVLDTYPHGPNLGAAEELLDETCGH